MARPDINTTGGLMPARGYDGGTSRGGETIIDSVVNRGATTIQPGQVVGRDPSAPRSGRLALVGDVLLGLVHRDPVTYHADSAGNVGFGQYRDVPFYRLGFTNATPVEEVYPDDGVVAIFTDGVFSGLGGTTNGLSDTRRLMKNHKWETRTAANAAEPGEVSIMAGNSVNYVTY